MHGESPGGAGIGRSDRGSRSGPVDLEIVGPVAAAASARQQQRSTAGEAAERLAGGKHRDEQDATPTNASAPRRLTVAGAG